MKPLRARGRQVRGAIAGVVAVGAIAMFGAWSVGAEPPFVPFPDFFGQMNSGGGGGGGGGGNVIGTGAAGQVTFWTGVVTVAGDTGFTYSAVTGVVINDAGLATLDTRIESDTNANAFFIDSSANAVGFFNATPTHKVDITAGALATGIEALHVTGTINAAPTVSRAGVAFNITSAGGGALSEYATGINMLAGYTGTSITAAFFGSNAATSGATIGNPFDGDEVEDGAIGTAGSASADWAGTNYGLYGTAARGGRSVGLYGYTGTQNLPANGFRADSTNIGVIGATSLAKNIASVSEKHIGVVGLALNGDTSVAGYFGLQNTTPIFATAALMADNGTTLSNIFVARNAGVPVCTIAANGDLTCTGTIAGSGTISGTGLADQVTFWTGASTIAGDTGLTFNPATGLAINPTAAAGVDLIVTSSNTTNLIWADTTANSVTVDSGLLDNSAGASSFYNTAQLRNTAIDQYGQSLDYSIVAGGAGVVNKLGIYEQFDIGGNYTGPGETAGIFVACGAGGTGITPESNANACISASAGGTTAGVNLGLRGLASGSSTLNAGSYGSSFTTAGPAIGSIGRAYSSNAGGSPQVGGYFHLSSVDTFIPTFVSAALEADNNDGTATGTLPIFIGRSNGTTVFTIATGGALTQEGGAVFNDTQANVDFRIESDTNANAFFVDASAEAVGFFNATPTHKIDITAGTLASQQAGLSLTSTLNTSNATFQAAVQVSTTTTGAVALDDLEGIRSGLLAGYTGVTGISRSIFGFNQVVGGGAGSDPLGSIVQSRIQNEGVEGQATATTTLTNVGTEGITFGGAINVGTLGITGNESQTNNGFRADSTNYGSAGVVVLTKNAGSVTEKHIGVAGVALGGDINVGGYFGLQSGAPTYVTAALLADNGATSANIFVARNAGVPVCTIASTGSLTCTGPITGGTSRQAAACAAGVLALNPTTSYVDIDANGAACVVTLAETSAVLGRDVTISIVTSAGAGAVTFPDVANVHSGPTLCTTTGIILDGVYTITYADLANDKYLGKACTQNS